MGRRQRPKHLKKCIKHNLQRSRDPGKNSLPWVGMDIFWNNTIGLG